MTLNITFISERSSEVDASVAQQLDEALAAIGFVRQGQAMTLNEAIAVTADRIAQLQATEQAEARPTPETLATVAAAVDTPKRERGKPGPGRKRRTAEEVAEDEAADKADAPAAEQAEPAQISSGEERVGPEDTAEVQAIDAADEAAEAEGGEIVDMLTMDNVRSAVGKYQTTFGMPATLSDIPVVLLDALGPLPEGTLNVDKSGPATAWRLSLIPDNQGALRAVVDGIEAAFSANRFKRDTVGL